MKFSSLLLASVPSTLAASLAYNPPAALLAKANDRNSNCNLPADYRIKNFVAKSNNTGATLSSYKFHYINTATNSSTECAYGPGSTPVRSNGALPRYSCNDKDVNFVWQDEPHKLSMIQKVCPDAKGEPEYEVTGALNIPLHCPSTAGACATNGTDFKAVFTSLNPVNHARVIRHAKKGVAWAFDLAS